MKVFIMILMMLTAGYLPIRHYATPALRRQIGWPFYFSVMSIIAAAAFAPNAWLLLAWCLVVPLISAGKRFDIACRYVLLSPLVPSVVPALAIGGHFIGSFALLDMVGLGTLLAFGNRGRNARDLPLRRGLTAEDALVLILGLVFSVGMARFDSPSILLRDILAELINLGIPYWILRHGVRSREELRILIAGLAVPGAMVSVIALYEAHAGWAVFDGIESRFAGAYLARSAVVRGGTLRAAVTLDTAITCGLFLLLATLATVSSRRFFRSPAVWIGTVVLLLLGTLSSQSRGALLGLGVGVVIMLAARRHFFWALLAAATGGVGLLGLKTLSHSSGRLGALVDPHGGTADYRQTLLRRGLQEGRKHPWLGTSGDQLADHLRDIVQGEQIIDFVNSYLHIFLLSGLVGLGACVLAILFIYRNLILVTVRSHLSELQMGSGFFIGGFSAMVLSLATISFGGRSSWFLMFLLAGSRTLALPAIAMTRPTAATRSPVPHRPQPA